MPASLRFLLADARFSLRPLTEIADPTLDAPLLWAHSSDLPDPTPWLEPAGLLLTDGVQFVPTAPVDSNAYVQRLVEHGITALGFAVHIVHDEVPADLVAACVDRGLPLLEVSGRTPFMGIIRLVSDALAADERERLERSLSAQRSVARAALQPDGLSAILRELERNLHCWVALFDSTGSRVPVVSTRDIPAPLVEPVSTAVRRALASGRTSATRLSLKDLEVVTLQTLGQHGRLRGVLAVGMANASLYRSGVDLVESVIALASIALEQSRTLDDARRRLRSGVLELLLAGVTTIADRTVAPLWSALPSEPLQVGCIAVASSFETDALAPSLEVLADSTGGDLFFGEHESRILTITSYDSRDALLDLLRRHGALAGFSTATSWDRLAYGAAEAKRAVDRSTRQHPLTDFGDLARIGLLGHLEHTRAHDIARRILAPLDTATREALEVWLTHNGAWDPAARALGIHRHTLRTRVSAAGQDIGLDLDTFAARAELWNALQLSRD